ncbi:MAG TPA: class IV adenylate cyclase [Bryobacteraceae bacterium]|nr:class IV adenylate cyclase [Bryobacteraceae bacterium]
MARNSEIKARLSDPHSAHAVARRLSGGEPTLIPQRDVFFHVREGRLKLRFLQVGGELIRYHRPDVAGVRTSEYSIVRTPDPDALFEILKAALDVAGEVRKVRSLYLAGQTRIHIDRVDGLGDFLELEVVLRPEQTDAEGAAIADNLLAQFRIGCDALIGEAYMDLLNGSNR